MEPDTSLKWSACNQCGLMVCPVTLRTCNRRRSCNHQRAMRPMSHHSGSHQHHWAVTRISAASRETQCFSTLRPQTKAQAKMKPMLSPPPKKHPAKVITRLSVIMRSGGSMAKIVKTESGAYLFKRPRVCIIQSQAGKQKNSRWHLRLFITIWSRKIVQIITACMQMRWSPTW